MRKEPSGIGTNRTGAPYAELDCSIHPLSSAVLTCCSISVFSLRDSCNGGRLCGTDPGIVGIHSGVRSPNEEAPDVVKLGA